MIKKKAKLVKRNKRCLIKTLTESVPAEKRITDLILIRSTHSIVKRM